MRHGLEMLWFLLRSFAESEFPLSYNAKVMNAHAQAINWLRDQPFEQGMTIYIYIDIFTISSEKAWVYENWQK